MFDSALRIHNIKIQSIINVNTSMSMFIEENGS